MSITTAGDFLEILDKSRLLSDEEFAAARRLSKDTPDAATLAKALAKQELLSRWQAGQLLAGRSTFFLGKYKLIELLGRGGMGSVFLAEHVTMRRRVALKIIPRNVGKDPQALANFLSEARTIASLDHPNIVQAFSVDNEADRYYLVMEYVDGMDLQQLVQTTGPLDFAGAADYIRQAADGLSHAHGKNLVHCDIKPSNLIVNPQNVVKILDLGVARLISHEGGESSDSAKPSQKVLGSVDYLAPEQALNTPEFNHRADIYSLGCTLYYLLTGHPPFPEGTLPQKILKHQTQDPTDLTIERADTPESLAEICRKMMAKEPADRYQTAKELRDVLAAWRPEVQPVKRVIPLKRAQPLDDLPKVDPLELDFGEDVAALLTPRPAVRKRGSWEAVSQAPWPEKGSAIGSFVGAKLGTLFESRAKAFATVFFSVIFTAAMIVGVLFSFLPPPKHQIAQGHNPTGNASSGTAVVEPQRPTSTGTAGNTAVTPPTDEQQASPSVVTPPDHAAEEARAKAEAEVKAKEEAAKAAERARNEKTRVERERQKAREDAIRKAEEAEAKLAAEPFSRFPKQVELPSLAKSAAENDANESKATTLGKVFIAKGAQLDVKLATLDGRLTLEKDATAPLDRWKFFFKQQNKDKREAAVIESLDGEITFAWNKEGATAAVGSLQLSGLILDLGGNRHPVQLSKSKPATALSFTVGKDTAQSIVTLSPGETIPADKLSFRVNNASGLPSINSPGALNGAPWTLDVTFQDQKFQGMALRILGKLQPRKLAIECGVVFEPLPPPPPVQQGFLKAKQLDSVIKQLEKQVKTAQPSLKGELQTKLDLEKKGKALIESLVNNRAIVHYQLFLSLPEGCDFILFDSSLPPAQEESRPASTATP